MSTPTNLVPTIEPTALPSTPANEWAESTRGILDAHQKPSTPLDTPDENPIPGSFPAERAPEPRSEETVLEKAKATVPEEDQVQRAITNAGQAAKGYLPPSVAAYLPSAESTGSDLDLTPPRPPFAADTLSNLSTEAQAGSMDSTSTLSGASARDNASTLVHTGAPGSPHPVAPLHLPTLGRDSPSRFVEDLGTPPAVASPEPISLASVSASEVASPEPISSSEPSEGVPAPPNSAATTLDSEADIGAGSPDVVAPPAPRGVIAPHGSAALNSSALKDNVPSGDDGDADADGEVDGDAAGEPTEERKKPKLVQRLKEKMGVGHTSAST
ncbi:hypothetical protein C8R46DRAFT_1139818 [Mycena filopes]|nr:hypothetical protein C8R46DRAFT_1139818 [Mycena filopes]